MSRDPWLCRTCAACLIQGVEPPEPEKVLAGLQRLGPICPDTELDGHMVYSVFPCDCCGSTERSERFRFNIIPEEEA